LNCIPVEIRLTNLFRNYLGKYIISETINKIVNNGIETDNIIINKENIVKYRKKQDTGFDESI
ncbi:MAG: hypothetical protein RRZ63_09410, partial [Clostridium sp.]